MGAWRPRIARDDKGKLHFVYARYDDGDPRQRCGMVGIGGVFNEGNTVEDMKGFAKRLLQACDDPVIEMTEYEYEQGDEDDEDDDDDDDV